MAIVFLFLFLKLRVAEGGVFGRSWSRPTLSQLYNMLFLREPKLILTLTVFFYELKAGLLDLDPHSFLLLDLDPEGKNCQIKTGKNARKLVIIS